MPPLDSSTSALHLGGLPLAHLLLMKLFFEIRSGHHDEAKYLREAGLTPDVRGRTQAPSFS
jgi:hypothetical protein